jgi:hypothetical protein
MALGSLERWLAIVVVVLGLALITYWLVIAIVDGREGTVLLSPTILGRCTPPTWFTANGCELIRYTSTNSLRNEIIKIAVVALLIGASVTGRSRLAIVVSCVIGAIVLEFNQLCIPLLILGLTTISCAWFAQRHRGGLNS